MSVVLEKLQMLETMIDASARSLRVSQLTQSIADSESSISLLRTDKDRLEGGESVLRKIGGLLARERSDAVGKHIRAFGPLATVIQRRLRSVYGFGDVDLLERGGGVQVEVQRGSVRLKPTDYFSDAEIQMLTLSLFLAGRITQTWSAFAPILLDDPVTHFDDLNCFSFVELLRGIVEDEPGKHQFVVSTCENRLFSLMRSRLATMGDRAIFYRFNSIASDGPDYERVAADG